MESFIGQSIKSRNRHVSFTALYAFILCFLPLFASADPINFIALKTHIAAEEQKVFFTTETAALLPFPTEDPAARMVFIAGYFDENFIVENRGSQCRSSIEGVNLDASGTVIRGIFSCNSEVDDFADLWIESRLFLDLFQDVNHFVDISIQDERREALLTANNRTVSGGDLSDNEENAHGRVGLFATIKQFVGLGIPHVLLGFDHVLFILAIHLIVRKYKDILIVVTSFTIAHSLTLILAALGVITVTSRVVEPFIAFTIGYTAVRNIIIVRQGRTEEQVLKERWTSAFGFGLVHGLGFAGALSEIKIPEEYFISALLSFNVGVEIGQLIVIAVFVSFLLLVKKWGFLTEIAYGLSGSIAVISSVWMIQRLI